jgi:hypothetical protein
MEQLTIHMFCVEVVAFVQLESFRGRTNQKPWLAEESARCDTSQLMGFFLYLSRMVRFGFTSCTGKQNVIVGAHLSVWQSFHW